MGQGRRHFTDEFKQEAIALLVSSGRPLSQIASELGIPNRSVRTGQKSSRPCASIGASVSTAISAPGSALPAAIASAICVRCSNLAGERAPISAR